MERQTKREARVGRPVLLRGAATAAVVAALAAISPLATPSGAQAQAGRSTTEQGNRLYTEGRFSEAHEKYLEALVEAPGSPVIRFNDGSALYQGEDYEAAIQSFRAAVEGGDPELAASAWYNLANALYRQQAFEESIEAYKQALRANPGDFDAKHNLERAIQQLRQSQQQQRQQPGEQDPDEQDPEQEPQDGQQRQDGEQPADQPQPEERPDDQEDPQNQAGADDSEQPPEQEEPPQESPQPGQMTREEAERLLEAIREDQDEVNRKPRVPARGTRPRRDW